MGLEGCSSGGYETMDRKDDCVYLGKKDGTVNLIAVHGPRMVSPQLARQEIRALCRSMTEEVDAAAAPQLGRSLKRVARADFENWLADRKTRWRAERGYEYDSDFSEVDLDDLRERAERHANGCLLALRRHRSGPSARTIGL